MKKVLYYTILERNDFFEFHISKFKSDIENADALCERISLSSDLESIKKAKSHWAGLIKNYGMKEIKIKAPLNPSARIHEANGAVSILDLNKKVWVKRIRILKRNPEKYQKEVIDFLKEKKLVPTAECIEEYPYLKPKEVEPEEVKKKKTTKQA